MHKLSNLIVLSIILTVLFSCQTVNRDKIDETTATKVGIYLPAEVISVDGSFVTVRVDKPKYFEESTDLSQMLSQSIIERSYFFQGDITQLNQSRVKILKVAENEILLEVLTTVDSIKPKERAKLFYHRRTIAIN